MKKTLIISNNVLSTQNNNGKTLLSFFRELPSDMLAQIYFSNEDIEGSFASEYYRISEHEILRSLFNRSIKVGSQFNYVGDSTLDGINRTNPYSNIRLNSSFIDLLRRSNTARIARELAWELSKIDHRSLYKWVSSFDPDVIFFCAGDSLFAYKIYQTVCSYMPNAKKVIYITDDYVTRRETLSPAWWLRRNLILNSMKEAVINSDLFITISEDMRNEYQSLLGKDSIIAFNMSSDIRIDNFEKHKREDLLLVYTGGLHFKRWETLAALARAIKQFNLKNNRSVKLEIYSHQPVEAKIKNILNVDGASIFYGGLNEDGVKQVLNNADILVHVESFAKDCIESTRLSVSTKISEYISVGNQIFAIGPSSIASMKLLKNYVCCADSLEDIPQKLDYLLNNNIDDQNLDELKAMLNNNAANFKNLVFQ